MASPAAQKKKEEKSLKALRELISIPHNKECVECHQKGPTYVDISTSSFICTQCSGFLRGLNPPHRVKSVSMTTFNDDEIEKLKSGGNEMARMVWLGNWDSRREREPDKKDEQAFREFLRDKYDRKKWYRDPGEVKKDIAAKKPETPSPKHNLPSPPPSNKPKSVAPPSNNTPTSSAASLAKTTPTTTTTKSHPQQQKPVSEPSINLIDTDPFGPVPAPKPPTGGVSVLPQAQPPTTPTLMPTSGTAQQGSTNDFGSFTSASSSSSGLAAPASSNFSLNSTQPQATPLGGGGSDKYAALASLDETLKGLRVREEEEMQREKQKLLEQQQMEQQKLQQQQMQQQMMQQAMMGGPQGMMGGAQGMMGGNPFNKPTPPLVKKDSNPFMMGGHSPPVTGPRMQQGQFSTGQQGFGGQMYPSNQGFSQGYQNQGQFQQQGMGMGQQGVGMGMQQGMGMGQQGMGMGQQGMGMGQQGMGMGQQGMGMGQQGMGMGQQGMGMTQQGQMMGVANQWGGVQSQQSGQWGSGPTWNTAQQSQAGFQKTSQFGQPTTPTGGLGTSVTSPTNTTPANTGWSNNMSAQSPQGLWGQTSQPQSQASGGWSSTFTTNHSGWGNQPAGNQGGMSSGGWSGQGASSGWGNQPVAQGNVTGGHANPFTGSGAAFQSSNPFL